MPQIFTEKCTECEQYHADGAEGTLDESGEILLEWTWNEVAFTLEWEEDTYGCFQ